MAIPIVDWEAWSASTIEPTMQVIVHFASGDVIYDDSRIEAISLDLESFNSKSVLFGEPEPSTGSVSFVDYEQELNPTLNDELVAGVQIDIYLGLTGVTSSTQLGPNLVDVVEAHQQVIYNRDTVWAFPFTTTEALDRGTQYMLSFDFEAEDGSAGHTQQIGTVEELFIAPDIWPENNHFAVTYAEDLVVSNLSVCEVYPILDNFGTFYAQEWTFDSNGSTATVDIIDGLNEILQLDNRASAAAPGEGIFLDTALITLLQLNVDATSQIDHTTDIFKLPYFFYEETQAATINSAVTALGGMLFMMPDGTAMLCDYTGCYDTGVTLTDDDVESYDISETSAITMDSAEVYALLPSNNESTEIVKYTNLEVTPGDFIPLQAAGVMSVDYLHTSGGDALLPIYDWDVVNLEYIGPSLTTFNELTVYGHVVEPSSIPVYQVKGNLPYSVKDNPYIQSIEQATHLVESLDAFIDMKYRIITITFRGCSGIWLGARLTINSARYNINAQYVVIGISFDYDGAVSTTLTLQRVVEVS